MAEDRNFELEIITPDRVFFKDQASMHHPSTLLRSSRPCQWSPAWAQTCRRAVWLRSETGSRHAEQSPQTELFVPFVNNLRRINFMDAAAACPAGSGYFLPTALPARLAEWENGLVL